MPKFTYLSSLILLLLSSCAPEEFQLQPGDLLFQQWDGSDFSKAINAVTEGYNGHDFAHVGLVLDYEGEMKVLEATTGSGVDLTDLDSFIKASVNSDGLPRISVGRLKQDYLPYVDAISEWSLSHLHKNYDTLFVYGDDKYYCAELLHDAFNQNIPGGEVFELAPMTFKNPNSETFFPVWMGYFADLQEDIPEGRPGINPGSMSRSTKLEIVHEYFSR